MKRSRGQSPHGSRRSKTPKRSAAKAIQWIAIAIVTAAIALVLNREPLEDWLNVTPKPPSPEIGRIAQTTTMTPQAQRIFYRQDPRIEPREIFLQECDSSQDIILLGCYIQHKLGDRVVGGKIIIQRIDDPQFQGILETTAAHEMLHAAYDQLSSADQKQLAAPLKAAAKRVTNPRLMRVLSKYEASDPALYQNELHSHLGSELADLGEPMLEEHYRQYFSDRQKVVAFAQQSQQTLNALDAQAETLLSEVEQLEAELEQARISLEQAEAELNQSDQQLSVLQEQLSWTQTDAENALRQNRVDAENRIAAFKREQKAFNQQVERHNAGVREQSDRVARFNQKVGDYQAKVNAYNQVARENRAVLDSLRGPLVPEGDRLPATTSSP